MRHKVNIKITLLLACLFLSAFGAKVSAQSAVVTVKGVVTDEYGKPLSGVIVNSSNGKNGSSTDVEGAYILTVDDGSDAIVFSHVGYRNLSEPVAEKEAIDAKLQLDVLNSDQIIDMGFTSQRRGDISGAVTSVSAKKIEAAPVATFSAAMNGFVPNLGIIQGTTRPSRESVSMFIRGYSNPRSSGTQPLFVIDGVFSTYDASETFKYMTAEEVESITVLRDASTQALYGVKGNSGVVVITTKRGVKGPVKITVGYDQSVQQLNRDQKFYNSWEYATFKNQAAYNDNPSAGKTSVYSPQEIAKYVSGEDPYLYPNNNWVDMFFKKVSTMSRAHVNVTGGSDKFTYYTQINFMHQGDQFKTTGERYKSGFNTNWFTYRTNVDIKVNKYLSSYLRLSGTVRRDRAPYGIGDDFPALYSNLYYRAPNIYGPLTPATYDNEGNVVDPGGKPIVDEKYSLSYYGILNRSGYAKITSVNINSQFGLDLDMSFLTKGLKLGGYIAYQTYGSGNLGAWQNYEIKKRNLTVDDELLFETVGTTRDTELSYDKSATSYYHLDYRAYLNYQRTFGKHSVQATGFIYYQNLSQADGGSSYNVLPFNTVLSGIDANYSYDNRYFVKFDLGYSATEQFSPDNRWVATPSISGAWNITGEKFMKDASKWLTLLKLRASYGRVADDFLNNGRHGYLDENHFSAGGLIPVLAYSTTEGKKGYTALRAQTFLKQNYGIDVGLFNGFIVSFDYFRERTDDFVISATSTIPEYQGVPTSYYPVRQEGIYQNKGFDVSASYYKRLNEDWSFNVGGWVSYSKNKFIYTDESKLGSTYAYRNRTEGFGWDTNWGLAVDYSNGNGFFNSQEELDRYECTYSWNIPNPRVGDLIFKDMNGDYIIDEKDVVPFGNTSGAPMFYGFSAGFTYKALEFNVMFEGVSRWGGFYYNGSQLSFNGIYSRQFEGAWTPERYAAGQTITAPAMSLKETSSTMRANNSFYWNDRSFLRLKNLEIAYTLPLKASRVISSDKIRFSLSGQNLFTWGKMKDKDLNPESGGYFSLPAYRIYNVGVSVLF